MCPDLKKVIKYFWGSFFYRSLVIFVFRACLQISEESYDGVKEFLEEFLRKWSYEDRRHYIVNDAQKKVDSTEGCDGHFVLGIDQYCKVAEMYAVTLLGTVLNDVDLAISWIEKASLPEEKRKVTCIKYCLLLFGELLMHWRPWFIFWSYLKYIHVHGVCMCT